MFDETQSLKLMQDLWMPHRPPPNTAPHGTFATRLAASRQTKGWSQAKLSREAKCSQGIINQIELGNVQELKAILLFRIADCLEVNPRWLALGVGALRGVGWVSDDERDLLLLYRTLPEPLKDHLHGTAQSLSIASGTKPNKADPFVGIEKPASQPAKAVPKSKS